MALSKTLLLIGGTSDIGRATALCYAKAGWRILLCARNEEEARRNAEDIAARTGAEVTIHRLDILQTVRFGSFLDNLPQPPDTAVCVVGELG
ncbi:MAG: SDR family NAD(P)-dependent oxidoreductase, partial [Microvirga sp.]